MDSKIDKNKVYKTIMLIVVVALITFIITTAYMYNKFSDTKKVIVSSNNSKLNAKINSIKKVIEKDYLGEVKEDDLLEGAVKGYVDGLGDEYTKYFTKEEMDDFKAETEGNYTGIGIYMSVLKKDNSIIVVATIKGSPAEASGIKSGDIIKKVDGKEYTGDDFDKIASYIKGKEGTKVNIEIVRDGNNLTFDVERKKIEMYPIESEVLDNNVGYISLPSFTENSSKEFKKNYENLKKQNIKSLIIDIRNNGGGIVKEALDMLDYILDKDKIMMITVNKQNNEEIEKTKTTSSVDVPIVVLVNENSASASEIFAGALKENNKATIVGEKTYGKGVIQELLRLADGSGIKITTEEYFTPNKNKINKEGISPDVEVVLPENLSSTDKKDDTQLKKAIEVLNNN